MPLSDIVNVSITTEAARVEQAGFGMPIILAQDCPGGFSERVRFYSDLTGLVADFATSTATYKMAAGIFAQDPKPPKIAVGRLALPATQRWAIMPTALNSTKYEMKVDGNLISITSDGTATGTEIIAALKTAIDALGKAITVSDQTTFMRIVANAAGAHFNIESLDISKLVVTQDHADPGVATDLAAIALEDSSWYAILNTMNSKAMALAIAAWAESNKKLFLCQTQDSNVVLLNNGADTGGAQTVAGAAKASAYFRTAIIYHPQTDAYADGAWAGKMLPYDPGSETWAFKTLAGVPVTVLTATQHANAIAKYVNTYELYAGVNVTGVGDQSTGGMGRVSGNEFIDVIRFRDWLENQIQTEVFAALAKAKKIPFTDGGISVIEGIIRGRLKAGVDVGGLSDNPAPKVTVPKAANVSSLDKAARKLTGIKFDAILAGAIQAVSLSGSVAI